MKVRTFDEAVAEKAEGALECLADVALAQKHLQARLSGKIDRAQDRSGQAKGTEKS
ncbi:hypothetical protein [Arsenicicoccus dermatophilus]|uniref:hypothetical protein n=1 Tax=Arsenicicoccus dermatophilus TaxID=1076331 RepID=UPI0039172F69